MRRMARVLRWTALCAAAVAILVLMSGCEMMPVQGTGGGISTPLPDWVLNAPPYTGPKIRVAVMAFDNKTGEVRIHEYRAGASVTQYDPVGLGMADQMVTALMQTGMFTVIERQYIEDVLREGELTGREVKLAPADYLIRGAVTGYQFGQSNFATGIGLDAVYGSGSGRGGWFVVAGKALSAMTKQDYVAIDVRVVKLDGEVVAATSVEGKARDLSGAMGGMFGSTLIGISGEYRTPTDKAVRACIIKAVNFIGAGLSRYQQAAQAQPVQQQILEAPPQPIR